MKTIKNNRWLILQVMLISILGLSSCKKDTKTEPDNSATPTGTFMFHLHTNLENNEVAAYNTVDTIASGRKVSLSLAQLYISNIQLVKLDGSTVNFGSKKILKVFETEVYVIGTAPVGNYKSIRFKVGLDSATNLLSSTTPSDSAILNRPEMWFGSTAQPGGYVFMNVQGKIDTTTAANGSTAQMQSFTYKIGTNAHYTQITMPDKNFSIIKDQPEYGHIIIDYMNLFTGLQLNQSSNLSVISAAANSMAPATTIANNIPLMFRYEN